MRNLIIKAYVLRDDKAIGLYVIHKNRFQVYS